jgi:DNA-binding NarL/FixJ family response regulator
MASLLIVDDEPDMRFLVRRTVEAGGHLSVVGEASTGDEAIRRFRELRPDAIVLDQRMTGLSGLDTAERILAEEPGQVIVLFTALYDADLARRAAEVGIRACLSKTELSCLVAALLAQLGDGNPETSGNGP